MNIEGKIVVITGGGGVLGSAISEGLAEAGAIPVILGRTEDKLKKTVNTILNKGGKADYFICDVLDKSSLETTFSAIFKKYNTIDCLVNGAGGNKSGATIMPNQQFSNLELDDFDQVVSLNLHGTVIPSMVAVKYLEKQKKGSIINISSMSAIRPMTRVVGYSAAKAGIDNFTKWAAVEFAQKYGEGIRVNAIAPGFFVAEQNKKLLLNNDGSLTTRGQKIINNTPFGRFGNPKELVGVVHFLLSDSSAFITGTIIPVDGGFDAYSGV